ncbi:MAG: DUF2950 family protein [Deltaproteobacteria bacterium]|nr:DUF2950 family protein [Deltaproteobacteria bacterium]
MVAGFALVAYPDRWDSSGIMTFLVNQEGRVYEKNLEDSPRLKIRNSKRPNLRTWKGQDTPSLRRRNRGDLFRSFGFWSFEFVSDFGFRISNLAFKRSLSPTWVPAGPSTRPLSAGFPLPVPR